MSWRDVKPCCRNGITRGYHAFLADHDLQENISSVIMNETTLSVEFHDLLPYYAYDVSVTAFNVKGIGPASKTDVLTGEEGRRLGRLSNYDADADADESND